MAKPVTSFALTPHAMMELERRGIDESVVRQVLAAPEQRLSVRLGRDVLQSRFTMKGMPYLVRVFVDTDRTPIEVVTAYRTSKVDKYWRIES